MKSIVITCGDPAGCGPLITLDALSKLPQNKHKIFVVGDSVLLSRISHYRKARSRFTLIDAKTSGIKYLKKGAASILSGKAALSYLRIALDFMQRNSIVRLVTAPLSKEAAQFTQPRFQGHTEFLAHFYNSKNFEMMMVSGSTKIVLVTRHIPLARVRAHISRKNFSNSLTLIYRSLQTLFKIKRPAIVCASVNPHAGLYTYLGKEEKIILHAIQDSHFPITGPLPADSLFTQGSLKKYDCIVCPYHDQGMIPFKLLSFYKGVNLTLGLPIIRTSPGHGVAYDVIKQRKKPFSTSMQEAIALALRLSPCNNT